MPEDQNPTNPAGVKPDEMQICNDEYERFLFYLYQGHIDYVEQQNRNFRYTWGAGGQWSDEDRTYYEKTLERKIVEENNILPAVESAVGEQIFSRSDIILKPRKGQASEQVAKILSKVVLAIQIDNSYHRKEKTLWKDGIIKQRGYFDIRMNFDHNLHGDVKISSVNPLCVMPDLYSDSYDPREWNEVTKFAWLSLDQIEGTYGREARRRAEKTHDWYSDNPWSDEFRSKNLIDKRYGFGIGGLSMNYEKSERGEKRLRVIERQYYKWQQTLCLVDPATGDSEPIPEEMTQKEAEEQAVKTGLVVVKQSKKIVYWRVSTRFCLLHDSRSPYRTYTLIPFFYNFDYGATLGMVDNAISMQDLHNKALTNGLHIFSTTSNGGWTTMKGALTNMSTEDLGRVGSKTGIVLEHSEEGNAPKKIVPNPFPEGCRFLMEIGKKAIKDVTGQQDADQMLRSHMPGDSTQSGIFQQKMGMADPKDNLEFSRELVGRKCVELVQDFYTSERLIKISDTDEYGKEVRDQVKINEVTATGDILNDITQGEYDVVVDSKPMGRSWRDSQFNQMVKLKEVGVRVPDDEVVMSSNLDRKHEIAEKMGQPVDDGGAAKANAALIKAKIKKTLSDATAADAKAINTKIQGIYGSVNSAQILATVPQAAPLADELLLSSGFTDAQIPEPISNPAADPAVPENKHPNFPPSATQGAETGATLR
jgi:hypothetical protein